MDQERETPSDDSGQNAHGRVESVDAAGSLMPSEHRLQVGDSVTIRGKDLPPSRNLELYWETVKGGWETVRKNQIVGVTFEHRTDRIDEVRTDERGRFESMWTVPTDFGGTHVVSARTPVGETIAECEVSLVPRWELNRTRAPLGETFTIIGYGLGPPDLHNNYRLIWDSGMVGYVTGLGNRGTATAEVRAVGPPGEHVLQIGPLRRGESFLLAKRRSTSESTAGNGRASWIVEVIDPTSRVESGWVDVLPAMTPIREHYPSLDHDTDATITTTPQYGQVGTEVVIEGRNLPPGATVDLVWYRHQGQRIQGVPITPEPKPDVLPSVITDDDGRFRTEVTIPLDLGGTRPITAEVNGESVAVTGVVIQPDVLDITPERGPVGTEVNIELTGLGWTEFGNSLCFTYDNKPIGYVCGGAGREGVENPGTASTVLRATGEPGFHFIDAYPNIFELEADEPAFVNVPHLSHRNNHPGQPLPALHFTFEITG